MEDPIEQGRKLIIDSIGEKMVQSMRDVGLDIDGAITNILQWQEQQQEQLDTQAECGALEDTMTSELVYRSRGFDDVYGREYKKRLSLLRFDEESIKKLYDQEKLILSYGIGIFQSDRKQPWVRRYFFREGITGNDLPQFGQLTLSELILITDDASSAYIRDHHVLSDDTWVAVCKAAIQAHSFGGAHYIIAFNDRAETLGWSEEQNGAYTKNECLLTERLKWGHHEKPAWTIETTALEQYTR
ncbi:MAG: hypothetical protein RL557_1045 [archaeon]|jgi:hypothetical protein